ncbi:DNA/RNA non-specific endonuclease [Muriicola sp.]|uniref:DNA/RNA non-specific endonuclease n=1 Tax=Muriicola sp. TaxID=2020856 RepID=UPI003C76DB70
MRSAKKDRLIYLVLLITAIILFWGIENIFWPTNSKAEVGEVGSTIPSYILPTSTTNTQIFHTYYGLSYNENEEQAEWVVYGLKRSQLTSDDRKRPYFIEDPKIATHSADWRNYKNSGYDRGHLCPAGDRRFSELAYNETFYTSNISTMKRDFNAGVWNRLEMRVRQWAKKYDSLYVITGGVLKKGLPSIGYESVGVPDTFYKIIVRGTPGDLDTIAFLIPHQETDRSLSEFEVPIDLIEEKTGIDFFYSLADEEEVLIESGINQSGWRY